MYKTTKTLDMKKNVFFLLLCITLAGVACKPGNKDYRITGEIKGIPDNTKIELYPGATHKQEEPIGEVNAKDGKFIFEGNVESPRLFFIVVDGYSGRIPVMVENGNITISGKFSTKEQYGQQAAIFEDIEIEGSPVHREYAEKRKVRDELDAIYVANGERNEEAHTELKRLRAGNNKDSIKLFMESDAYKQLAEDEKNFFEQVEKRFHETVMQNKDSWWGPFMMMDLFSYFSEDQKPWYESLSQEAKDSYYGQLVKKELFPETLMGKTAPDFTAPDQDGKSYSLKELLAGNRYLLIDFWASWCGPCRKSIPQLKAFYKQYKDKGLAIAGVSLDKKESDWTKALEEEKMPWTNLLGNNDIFEPYGIKTIPAVFIIDATTGTVVGAQLHGESLTKKLDELFK